MSTKNDGIDPTVIKNGVYKGNAHAFAEVVFASRRI